MRLQSRYWLGLRNLMTQQGLENLLPRWFTLEAVGGRPHSLLLSGDGRTLPDERSVGLCECLHSMAAGFPSE